MTPPGGSEDAIRFRLEFDEALVRRAASVFLKRVLGRRYLIELLVASAIVVAMAIFSAHDALFWIVTAVVLVFASLPLLGYLLRVRHNLAKLARLPDRGADFRADAMGFAIDTQVGGFSLRWDALSGIWTEPGFWLLRIARNDYVTVPLAHASADDLIRLQGYVDAAGTAAIRGRTPGS